MKYTCRYHSWHMSHKALGHNDYGKWNSWGSRHSYKVLNDLEDDIHYSRWTNRSVAFAWSIESPGSIGNGE